MPIPELYEAQVLVTGGAGFIGSHLVDALLSRGARVRVLDNLATGRRENLHQCLDRIELIEGDIRDVDICRRATSGCRLVFHQAALGSVPRSIEDPITSFEVNVQGTVNIFAAAHETEVERVVYASSSSVYGDSRRSPKREGEEGEPLSPYASTKRINEEIARVFARTYRLETVGLRYFNIYGDRQNPAGPYAAVIPRFFQAALSGGTMVIYGDGEQSRDFTHVSDAVRGNLLAAGAASAACGRAFNIAVGRAASVNELAREIARLCRTETDPRYEPPRPGDVKHSLADLELSRQALGFSPATDLASGLAKTLDYYRSRSEAQ